MGASGSPCGIIIASGHHLECFLGVFFSNPAGIFISGFLGVMDR